MPKVIVITGGGAGLGRAMARRMAKDGHTLLLLGRTLSKVEAVAKEIGNGSVGIECDITSPDSVRKAFAEVAKRHPRIDVMINNAAVYEPFTMAEATDRQILGSIASNFTGAVLCTRSAIPLMGAGSHLVNISSESVVVPMPHLTMYQASKAGLERFNESMVQELEPAGIRVTMVRAGQMFEPEKMTAPVNGDPAAWGRFRQACLAIGLDLTKRPISQFTSVAQYMTTLIDLPPDLHVGNVTLHARRP